jgi:hypothetical protein
MDREVLIRGAIIGKRGNVLHSDYSFEGNDTPDQLRAEEAKKEVKRERGREGEEARDVSNLKEEIEEWESGDEAIASLRFKLQRCFRCSIRIDETTSFVLCRHIHPPGREGREGGRETETERN